MPVSDLWLCPASKFPSPCKTMSAEYYVLSLLAFASRYSYWNTPGRAPKYLSDGLNDRGKLI